MANVSGLGTNFNSLNYLGEVFLPGTKGTTNFLQLLADKTPRRVYDIDFALSQDYDLETPAQKAITEADSVTAPTAITYTRSQEIQSAQIFQYTINLTDMKLFSLARRAGLNQADATIVTNELVFQIEANMAQMRLDLEFHYLNGTYQKGVDATTASQMRGILNDSNIAAVAADGAPLDKALMNVLFKEMADNGAKFQDSFILVPAAQKANLDNAFAFEPTDRFVAGVRLQRLYHTFGKCDVLYVPNTLASSSIAVVDAAFIEPVFIPQMDGREVVLELLARTGMAQKHQLVTLASIDYMHGSLHGKLTGLAV